MRHTWWRPNTHPLLCAVVEHLQTQRHRELQREKHTESYRERERERERERDRERENLQSLRARGRQ